MMIKEEKRLLISSLFLLHKNFSNFDKKSSKTMSKFQLRGCFALDKLSLYEYNKATI